MTFWIKTEDELPPMGRYVFARYNGDNWHDSGDQRNVNCVVVKREAVIVRGNDLLPFRYLTFGSMQFFAQDISHWAPIPAIEETA